MKRSAEDLPLRVDDRPEALERLETTLRGYESLLVAFSGGVDSGVLLAVSQRVLAGRVVALTADSDSMPRRELQEAVAFTRNLGIRHVLVKTDELQREEYRRNDRNRCYSCKQTLFEAATAAALQEGIPAIAYGYTADDAGDYRPGHRAAAEFAVHAPLFDAGLGKREIRAVARHLGLPLADKPAAPCLSSRIPYGSEVTVDKLAAIERMEEVLHDLGFSVCRARFDGSQMRLEFEPQEIARAAQEGIRETILDCGRQMGVTIIAIDLEGFRSGKLNEV